MDRRLFVLTVILIFCFGCGRGTTQVGKASDWNRTVMAPDAAGQSGLVFDPLTMDGSALPDIHDLPTPPIQPAKKYTGIIKNNTRFDVSILARNSSATITIPAYGWVEYTAWNSYFNVTVYHDGKPFYCLNIHAHLQNYPFMCKKYDFIAEIVKEEPVIRQGPSGPSKLKHRKIKRKVGNPPC
jgi:hypothetical protein